MPRLKPAPLHPRRGDVSILVPARGEEATLPPMLRALAEQGAHEVIVCDDGDNGTGLAEAEALGIKVITPPPLPDGWIGKSWACEQLAQSATGDMLVFTDAGTEWQPGSLDAILAMKEHLGADLLSVLARIRIPNFRSRLLAPLLDNLVLSAVPWPILTVDKLGKGVASGSLIAVDRGAYDASGGHRAIRDRILDDVELARSVQRTRLPHGLGKPRLVLGHDMLEAVLYDGYTAAVRGFGKSLVATLEGSRALTVGSVAIFTLSHTVVWLIPPSPWVWGLRIAGLTDRSVAAWIAGRRRPADVAEGLLGPVTPLLAAPGLVVGLRRNLSWRGRNYPAATAQRSRGTN